MILKIINDIDIVLMNEGRGKMLSVDSSSAFDRVCIEILMVNQK